MKRDVLTHWCIMDIIQLGGGIVIKLQDIEFHQKAAVYPQLADYIKKGILLGVIVDGEDMPSRRELALRLSINPNTVQKAYKLLEDEGFIRTISNIRSIAVVTQDTKERSRCQLIEQQVKTFITDCKSCGMNFQQTIAIMTTLWDKI